MTVITVSREFGSFGDLLAERVAHALDYHCVDKAFISSVLCQYGLAEFDLEYEKQPGFWGGFDIEKSDRRAIMVSTLNRVIRTLARHGNVVILGRSGYAVLSGLADVLHVRLHAPLEDRIATVMAEQNISQEAAASFVKEKDRTRTAFIESFYRVPWNDANAFDIAINTSSIPLDVATSWVIEAVRFKSGKSANKPTTQQIEVDPVMMLTVTEKLHCKLEHAGVA